MSGPNQSQCTKCGKWSWDDEACACQANSELAPARGSVECAVVTELMFLRHWIKAGDGYIRDDAPDEIARAIDNRIAQIESNGWSLPPNSDSATNR